MKIQMNKLLETLKLECNLMNEQLAGNVEGVRSLISKITKVIGDKWAVWEQELVKSVHEQREHITSELRG